MAKGILRVFYICIGTLSLILGVIGIFLPVLPTTPLLLLTGVCYVRSSQRLYEWLMNHRYFGPYLKAYYEKKGIPLKTKIVVLSTLWLSILMTTFVIIEVWYLRWMLWGIATGVTIFILKQQTLRTTRLELEQDQELPLSVIEHHL